MASKQRRTQRQEIPFPIGGFSENNSFSDQEPFTCRDELNVRSIDPATGRTRGAQRAGLGVYSGAAQLNGANKIQAMASVAVDKTQLTWSAAVSNDWEAVLTPTQAAVADIKQDDYGNIYVLGSDDSVFKFNEDGGLIATITVPVDIAASSSAPLVCLAVDEYQNVFVGRGCSAGSAVTDARLYAFEYKIDSTYGLAWSGSSGEYMQDIVIFEGALIVATSEATPANDIFLRLYPAYTMTEAPAVDAAKTWTATMPSITGGENLRHQRLALRDDGVVYMSICSVDTDVSPPAQIYGRVEKINLFADAPATSVWSTVNDGSSTAYLAGIGMGIAIGPTVTNGDRSIYTTGHVIKGDESTLANVRRLQDTGTTVTATGGWEKYLWDTSGDKSTGWEISGSADQLRQRIATDEDDRLYVPYGVTDVNAHSDYSNKSFLAFDTDGTVDNGLGGINDSANDNSVNVAITVQAKKPDYVRANALGAGSATIDCAEWAVYGGTKGDNAECLWRTRMATVTQGSGVGQTRILKVLAASNGTFKTVDTAEFDAVVGGTYDSNASYVQMVQAFSKVYIADGKDYYVYDPTDDLANGGTVSRWASTSIGSIPSRCRLIEVWRGRMVLARDPEDPSDWHMIAIFQPNNWDQFPQVPSAAQAVSAENSRGGKIPDVVNAIIPYNDDLCLFGGDHSIWRLTGDPMAGGQLDLVTDETGISFGRPWTKDPMGRLWFVGSRGSLYVMTGTGQLDRVSEHRVSRSLQSIDFSSYYVQLVWNYIDEGLHIFVLPFGAGGAIVDHWFFDAKNNAFHKDNFGSVATDLIQPTAALQVDGDDYDDRVVMVGCEDGRIRRWGKNQAGTAMPYSDQRTASANFAIDSFATIGPIAPVGEATETQVTEFNAVLADDQDGCNYEFFVTGDPGTLGVPRAQGGLVAGRNPTKLVRMSGDSIYLRMRNGNAEQRWALEKASALMSMSGPKRSR